jgi:hypothetical protein
VRRAARVQTAAYGLALFAAGARVGRRAAPADFVLVPAVMAVMHISWGVGFLSGCARLGPPAEGLTRVARGLLSRDQPSGR